MSSSSSSSIKSSSSSTKKRVSFDLTLDYAPTYTSYDSNGIKINTINYVENYIAIRNEKNQRKQLEKRLKHEQDNLSIKSNSLSLSNFLFNC